MSGRAQALISAVFIAWLLSGHFHRTHNMPLAWRFLALAVGLWVVWCVAYLLPVAIDALSRRDGAA